MKIDGRPHWVRWYKTANWLKIRRKQLAIEPLCRFCKKKGILTPGNTVDHIQPHKGDIDKFFSGPFQTLCKECHSATKQKLEKSGDFGCDEKGFGPSWGS